MTLPEDKITPSSIPNEANPPEKIPAALELPLKLTLDTSKHPPPIKTSSIKTDAGTPPMTLIGGSDLPK